MPSTHCRTSLSTFSSPSSSNLMLAKSLNFNFKIDKMAEVRVRQWFWECVKASQLEQNRSYIDQPTLGRRGPLFIIHIHWGPQIPKIYHEPRCRRVEFWGIADPQTAIVLRAIVRSELISVPELVDPQIGTILGSRNKITRPSSLLLAQRLYVSVLLQFDVSRTSCGDFFSTLGTSCTEVNKASLQPKSSYWLLLLQDPEMFPLSSRRKGLDVPGTGGFIKKRCWIIQ